MLLIISTSYWLPDVDFLSLKVLFSIASSCRAAESLKINSQDFIIPVRIMQVPCPINSGLIHTLSVVIVFKILTWWRSALWPNWFWFLSEETSIFFFPPKGWNLLWLSSAFFHKFLFLYFLKRILNLFVFPSTMWHCHTNLQNILKFFFF